ncbi:MAG: hypothetical protein LBC74_09905, partial [Planctomycetaceae bacterium]|nr:hypothetical protein [Planctomycetaceae bacterium]
MEFLKQILGRVFRLLAGKSNEVGDLNWLSQNRKVLRLESLESRELLAGMALLADFTGYASTFGETEVRFELKNSSSNKSQIQITLDSLQSTFDPSAIRLQTSSGIDISLTNVFNTTVQSGGTAFLGEGSYSVFFKADSGNGNFNLKVSFVESTPVPNLSAMTVIIEAAKLQQMPGWDGRRNSFNAALYSVAPEYGRFAFNGGMVIDLFPEADVNKDGKLDNSDAELAVTIANGNTTETKPEINEPNTPVIYPDKTPPVISATLITPTQNGITTNPAITGQITDQNGIKSAFYKLNNNTEQQITLAKDGSFTILNNNIAEGKCEITIIVTDNYGNVTTASIPEFTYQKQIINPPTETILDDGNGTAIIDPNFKIVILDDKNITANNQITLDDNIGIITINQNNVTINAGSCYDYLAQNETTYLTVSVQLIDVYNKTYTSEIVFTIKGKNDTPELINNEIITLNINECEQGIITVTEIIEHWKDSDRNDTLSVVNASIETIEYSDNNLISIFNEDFIKERFNLDQNGNFIFDASDLSFAQLAAGETISITINYQVSDSIAQSSGKAIFIVTGKESEIKLETKDNITEINSGYTNDYITQKEIDFGFCYKNPDAKNVPYSYIVTNILVNGSETDNELIINFDNNTGKFIIDTTKLSNREIDTFISITIAVSDDENVIISRDDLTIKLTALSPPSADNLVVTIDETSSSNTKIHVTQTSGNSGVEFANLILAETNNTQLADFGINDLSLIAVLDNDGNFKFDPQEYFVLLAGDQSVTLNLQYTIIDKQHGNSGIGYISVTINGKATLPQDAGDQIKIDNSADDTYVATQNIIVTKTEILAQWNLPENAKNFVIAEIEDIIYVEGFDGENNFPSTPFEEIEIGNAIIDEDGNIVFTPNNEFARKLSAGQWIEIEIKYSLRNKFDDSNTKSISSSVIIRITGQNDSPESTSQPEFNVNDNETLEIDWQNYFNDIDLHDTLTITKINGQEFDESNEIIIEDIGKFYFDVDKLKFNPAEKFASLKKDSTKSLNIILTVADSANEIAYGNFKITVTGTNKQPTAANQEKTIQNGESATFELDEVNDKNEGDEHEISTLEIYVTDTEIVTLDKVNNTATLDNGIIVTFEADANTVTIDSTKR